MTLTPSALRDIDEVPLPDRAQLTIGWIFFIFAGGLAVAAFVDAQVGLGICLVVGAVIAGPGVQ